MRDPRGNFVFNLAAATFCSLLTCIATGASALQTVLVDFDTYTVPSDDPDDYVYSPAEKAAVIDKLKEIYLIPPGATDGGPFGIEFVDTAPPFTATLAKLNLGSGGHSEKIDFRNLDDDDDVELHPIKILKSFVGTPRSAALGGGVWTEADLLTSDNVVLATAHITAHELNHSFGIRHHDAFTPIGAEGLGVAGTKYTPTYMGTGITNTEFHIAGLNSAVALSADNLLSPSWLSPRTALKLAINKAEDEIGPNPYVSFEATDYGGDVSDDGSGSGLIDLIPIAVPNTTQAPDPFGFDPMDPFAPTPPAFFPGKAGIAVGKLEMKEGTVDKDIYSFFAEAGDRITIEAISEVLSFGSGRFTDPVDTNIELLDSSGVPLGYPTATGLGPVAFNDDQFESTDSILFDVLIPSDGLYFIELTPAFGKSTFDGVGDYELLVYSIKEIPEPASLLLLAGMIGGFATSRRR